MPEKTEAEKRNIVHLNKLAEFSDQVFALRATVVEDVDFALVKQAAGSIATTLRGLYNNREIALVCTKLDEAQMWCDEKSIEQVRDRLTEARGWVNAYMEVLKKD